MREQTVNTRLSEEKTVFVKTGEQQTEFVNSDMMDCNSAVMFYLRKRDASSLCYIGFLKGARNHGSPTFDIS